MCRARECAVILSAHGLTYSQTEDARRCQARACADNHQQTHCIMAIADALWDAKTRSSSCQITQMDRVLSVAHGSAARSAGRHFDCGPFLCPIVLSLFPLVSGSLALFF
jgi:hypothetical protein